MTASVGTYDDEGTTDPWEERESQQSGRMPPQDLDAERSCLGSMLISTDAIAEVVEVLRGRDFYLPAHELIFDAIVDLFGRGEPVDMVLVAQDLAKRELAGKLPGGGIYLHKLASEVPLAANAGYYAEIVRGKAVLRRLADAGLRVHQMATQAAGDVSDIVDHAQTEIMDATPTRASEDYRVLGETLNETIDEIEATAARGGGIYGVPTGFADLDDLLGGLHAGQMVIVAGRPAMGKSTIALDFCRSASIRHRLTSVFFSLEMGRHEINARLLSAEAKIELNKVRSGNLSDSDWQRIAAIMPDLASAPFFTDDSPNLTMTEIRAKARRLKQKHDLRLIVIDYLQLMSSGRKVESRQLEVSEFSRQIKLLAKELEVPIVALSQLNRGVETRSEKRPMLSDLRESGSLEQDADVVALVHRPDMYEAESTRPGEADIIIAKHRNGPTRDVAVAFQGHYSRFVDMAHSSGY